MKRLPFWSWLWLLLGILYFFLPLFATFEFSLRARRGEYSFDAYQNVLNDPHIIVIPQSHTSFLDALALYEARLDKQYSLTDCVAMQAMRRW